MALFMELLAKSKGKNKGFTLIELVVVFGIIMILAGFSLPVFLNLGQKRDLNSYSRQIRANLVEARTKARGQGDNWGVHLTSSDYYLFKGSSYQDRESELKLSLPDNLTFKNISLKDSQVVFSGTEGEFVGFSSDSNSFDLINNKGESKTFTINRLGVINAE